MTDEVINNQKFLPKPIFLGFGKEFFVCPTSNQNIYHCLASLDDTVASNWHLQNHISIPTTKKSTGKTNIYIPI